MAGEATNGPLRSIRWVRRTFAVLLFLAAFAGCGSNGPDATPTACLDPATAYLSALQAAPDQVRLGSGTAISDCFGATQEAGELANVGQTVIRVATQLNAEARRDPGGEDTVMLGYLAGAVHEGTSPRGRRRRRPRSALRRGGPLQPERRDARRGVRASFGKGYAAGRARRLDRDGGR